MILENYLLVGTIVGTRGLDGTFKVVSSSYFAPIRYQKGNKLLIKIYYKNHFHTLM